jgi:hypothetical protein
LPESQPDKPQRQANRLLRQEGYNVRPPRKPVKRMSELSIEEFAQAERVRIPIPPEAIQRLVDRASNALYDDDTINPTHAKRRAMAYALSEAQMTNRQIAVKLGVHETTVCKDLRMAKAAMWNHIDRKEGWFFVFCRELEMAYKMLPHSVSHHDPMPEEVEQARVTIEEATGWQTWVIPQDITDDVQHIRLIVKEPSALVSDEENKEHQHLLTALQLLHLAKTGAIYLSQHSVFLRLPEKGG